MNHEQCRRDGYAVNETVPSLISSTGCLTRVKKVRVPMLPSQVAVVRLGVEPTPDGQGCVLCTVYFEVQGELRDVTESKVTTS